VSAYLGYVRPGGGGLGEIGSGGDSGVVGREGWIGFAESGSGGREPKAEFRVEGSWIAWKAFEETSTVDRMVRTSLKNCQLPPDTEANVRPR
jgi:hypothetical protein